MLEMPQWYAIYTKSRFEKKLYNSLRNNGYRVFLPIKKELRIWSDRVKKVYVPLIPGYIFINSLKKNLNSVYNFPGFVCFVNDSCTGKPGIIDQKEIDILTCICNNDLSVYQISDCSIGDRVKIVRGPMKGIVGFIEKNCTGNRVIFSIDSLKKSFLVEIHKSHIQFAKS